MNTIYKTNYKNKIASPYQATYKKNTSSVGNRHPAQEEIDKCVKELNFTAVFSEDKEAVAMFKDKQNLIAFVCTLKLKKANGDVIVGQGRSMNILNQDNKYISRAVKSVWNYAFLDSVSKSARIIDAFQTEDKPISTYSKPVTVTGPISSYKAKEYAGTDSDSEMASEKQKSYLTMLLHSNINDEEECGRLESQLYSLTKSEASEMIQSFS